MPAPRDVAMIVKAARLYYDQGRSQTEVAKELNLSRSNVSRILTQARERGIVEITIHDPDGPPRRHPALEGALRSAFPLQQAHVVSAGRSSGIEAVSRQGASILGERVRHVRSVGISWGQTVQSLVECLDHMSLRPPPRVLPLVGGNSALDQLESGDSVLRVLASRLGARPETLYAPAVLESATTAQSLRADTRVQAILSAAARAELAVVGIGSTGFHSSPHLLREMALSPQEQAVFEAQEPVGDVCGRFVDIHGRPLGEPTSQRVLAVTVEELQRIPEVIGVAAGHEKAPGVIGVLRSGVVNTVVVDERLAQEILEQI